MILASAKINNYKSIGTKNNVLYVENTVTALIGKNESGKSNVLEALGLINLWQPLNTDYLKKLTHGQSEPPSVSLIFSFSARDKETFPTATGTSTLIYTGTKVSLEGGLSNLISQDMTLASNIESLQTVIRNNELKLDNTTLNTLKIHATKLATLSENIYSSIFSELDSAKSLIFSSLSFFTSTLKPHPADAIYTVRYSHNTRSFRRLCQGLLSQDCFPFQGLPIF